eukprot:6177001-Pleurochrysis_carterae.AAC.1
MMHSYRIAVNTETGCSLLWDEFGTFTSCTCLIELIDGDFEIKVKEMSNEINAVHLSDYFWRGP